MWIPGVLAAAAAALLAWGVHLLTPAVPLLTLAVLLGVIVGQLPPARLALEGALQGGLAVASKGFMRVGIVLLGLGLSLVDIRELGWVTIVSTVAIVLLTFAGTLGLGRWFGLPGHQPLLIATGFSVCGASAIGAMSGVVRARDSDTATPVALVTLFGTLAIGVLPLLWHPLGLSSAQFGHWVGAGVHDVGQVVATAQIAGPAALAVAVVVKLTRVLMLAPLVAAVSLVERRRSLTAEPPRSPTPLIPAFVAGFLVLVVVRTLLPVPVLVLDVAATVHTALLAMALFALGSNVRLGELLRTGGRALLVGLLSWTLIAALAFGAVQVS